MTTANGIPITIPAFKGFTVSLFSRLTFLLISFVVNCVDRSKLLSEDVVCLLLLTIS